MQKLVSVRDMAKNAEVRSGKSSTTKSAKNLLLDMAKDAKVAGSNDGSDDETVKKSPFFKKPNVLTEYVTSLRSGKR